MIDNYKLLSNGRDAWLKKDVGEIIGSPPAISLNGLRTSWLSCLIGLFLILTGNLNAQCIVGTGTATTNGSTIDPVERYYNHEHFQMIYTAAELSAGGLIAGSSITALGFSISESASSLANFTISMGHTTQTAYSTYVSALTVVKPAFTYAPVVQTAGSFDMITLTTAFVWNGTSSIVVNTCTGSNPFTSPYGGLRYTATTSNTIGYSRVDGATSNCATTALTASTTRPNIRFNFTPPPPCSGTPAPGNTVASSTTTCPGTAVTLSPQNSTTGTGVTYQWQSASTLAGPYTNVTGATSSTYSPVINADTYFQLNVTCSGNTGTTTPIGITLNPFTTCYPVNYATNSADEDISNVTVGSLNNTSNCTVAASGSGSVLNRYANYTSLTPPDLPQSAPTNFSVTQTTCGGNYGNGIQIYIDYDHSGSYSAAERVWSSTTAVTGNRTDTGSFTIPNTALLGITGMRVISIETTFPTTTNYSSTTYAYGETEDYFVNITVPPACVAPTGLTASNVTFTGATVNWTAASPVPTDGYEFAVTTSAAAPASGTASASTSQSVTGLVANTIYYLHVRSVCTTGTSYSSWATISFYTGYCSTSGTNGTYYISNFSTNGGISNVNNSSLYTAGGYENYTAQTISQSVGANVNYSITIAGGSTYGVGLFIDWNGDLDFNDANETVYASGAYISSPRTGSFTVPAGTPIGNYRLRIVEDFLATSPGPCGANTYKDAEDYTFSVVTPPTCYPPTALAANSVTSSGASFTWTAPTQGAPSNYEYEVRSSGAAGSGASGLVTSGSSVGTSTSVSVSGLSPNTLYTVYVRTFCGGSDYSSWTSGLSFTTLCATSSIPFSEGFNAAALPSCWTKPIVAGTGDYISTVTTGSNPTTSPQEGTYMVQYNSFSAANLHEQRLVSKPLATTGYSSIDVKFYWRNDNIAAYSTGQYLLEGVTVQYSTNGGSTWTSAGALIPRHDGSLAVGASQWNLKSVSIAGAGNQSSVLIGFLFHSGFGNNCFMDNLSITPTVPTVASFTPASVCNGGTDSERTIVITGSLFTNATAVSVNGSPVQSFTINGSTQITAIVASSNTSGLVSVTDANGTGSSTVALTVNATIVPDDIQGANFVCLPKPGDPVTTVTLTNNIGPGTSANGGWSSSDTDVATISATGVVTPFIAGPTTITYTVTSSGCSSSKTLLFNVYNPVIITASTPSQTVSTASDATDDTSFSVTATGSGNPSLTYQWQVSSDGETFNNITDGGVYSGSTTSTLVLTNVTNSMDGLFYQCLVTGICSTETSPAATLTAGATGITTPPSNVTLCGGGNATFTIVASDDVTSYQWFEDQGGDNFLPITDGGIYSGAQTASLTLTGVTIANSGWKYYCHVEGIGMADSSPATLIINQSPAFTTNPADATVCYTGGTSSFTAAASNNTSYQWQYATSLNGSYSNVAAGIPAGTTYTGALTGTLNVTTTGSTPAGGSYFYRLLANAASPCTSVASTGAQLIINNPTITTQPSATSVLAGNSTTMNVVASTLNTATYQWQYSTTVGSGYVNIVNGTPAGVSYDTTAPGTLTISTTGAAVASNARYYRVIVSSGTGCSITSSPAQLTITNYCQPTVTTGGTSDSITNAVITNTSTSGNVTQASSAAAPYYTFYNNTPLNVSQGQTLSVAMTFGADGAQYSAIWVDYNRNGTFEASENVALASSAAAGGATVTYSFTVPFSALPGVTRIRLSGASDSAYTAAGACSSSSYGETEDYLLNVIVAPACSGAPTAGSITTSAASVCVSGSVTLTATGYTTGQTGISFQWYNSSGSITGATNASYVTPVLTAPETYYFRVICANGGGFANTNSITIGVNNPQLTSTTPAVRCGAGPVTLQATGSAGTIIDWYAAASGGSSLFTGTSYTIPNLGATTTFYVSAGVGSSSSNFGKSSSTGADGNFSGTATGIVFNATNAFTLNSTVIYPVGTGNVTVALYDSAGIELASTASIAVTGTGIATPVTLPLGFNVPTGNGYRLLVKAISGVTGLIRDFTGVTYPYSSANASVTGGWISGASASYYFFYNLSISIGCASPRQAVTATVNTAPTLTISSSAATICSGTSTGTVTITSPLANYNTYTWSPSTGVSGTSAAGYTFNPTSTTVYTLTGYETSGDMCQNTATFTVTVNQSPTPLSISPSTSTICSNGAAQQLTASGGVVPLNAITIMSETFNASAPSWTIVNGGASPAVSNFAYKDAPYTDTSGSATFSNFSTVNGGKFALANSDAGGSGSVTNTQLISPVFSTVGYTSATLSFEHGYQYWASGDTTVKLEISTDGGTTWAQLVDYKGTNVGVVTSNSQSTAPASVSLASYLGQANLKIRYNYVSTWGYYWIVDNVKVVGSGSGQGNVIWSPTTGLYTDAAASIPYTGTAALTVYAKPTATATYTATVTTSAGCPASTTATVNVVNAANYYADADGDGYGNAAVTYLGCPQSGYVTDNTDCNDAVAAINPGHAEVLYNGVDDNCNGQLDEGNQLKTKLLPESCGATLSSINSLIGITTVSSQITGYRIRVTNGSSVQIIEKNVPHFTLPELPTYAYATTYTVEIELQRLGVWLGYYGDPCLVSSPPVLTQGGATQVSPSQCGGTLAQINTLIATTSLAGVTGYRFRVTNLTTPTGPNVVQIIDRAQHWFSLQMLAQYNYATTYQIEIAIKTTGTYGGYGGVCNITSPAAPGLTPCGGTIAASTTRVSCSSLNGVTQYRFQIIRDSDGATTTIDRNTNYFTFAQVPGYTPNALYNVRVAVMTTGIWSPFGDACQITSPPSVARHIAQPEASSADAPFSAVAYPNPFANDFKLDVTTTSEDKVEVMVYDMAGRLIESRQAGAKDVSEQEVGSRYPAGVYNVVVTQGANVKTLRVVKR